MQNGKYEDEIELLHLRNAELEPRVIELEDDIERILICFINDLPHSKKLMSCGRGFRIKKWTMLLHLRRMCIFIIIITGKPN